MGVALTGIDFCLYVALWARSVQSRVDEIKKILTPPARKEYPKEIDLEKGHACGGR
ncbi:hypothetical protein PG989_014022 [Apiospora arundinis]